MGDNRRTIDAMAQAIFNAMKTNFNLVTFPGATWQHLRHEATEALKAAAENGWLSPEEVEEEVRLAKLPEDYIG